jgi:hypothetical protein
MAISEAERGTFRRRFTGPVELLITQKHSGFALMMITLPLLERLLRGRSHLKDGPLTEPFYAELFKVFPTLQDEKGAKALWQCFRNGILHQATFSLKRADGAGFSGVVGFEELFGRAVAIQRSGDPEHIVCTVDPVAFAQTVLAEVESDLETFQTADPDEHPIVLAGDSSDGVYSFLIPLKGIDVDQASTSTSPEL